ncbi:hypothetical protein NFI96_008240, partial [Prochilodus magdalenae]
LYDCSIGEKGCIALVNALKSNPSHLRELDLDWNKPGETAKKMLSALLEDPHCKLEKLDLWFSSPRCNTGLRFTSPAAVTGFEIILGPAVRPYADAVGPGFLLVHNNARPHVARVCRQFLENEGIDNID